MLAVHLEHFEVEEVVGVSLDSVQPQAVQRADARAPIVPVRVATDASIHNGELLGRSGDCHPLKCLAYVHTYI